MHLPQKFIMLSHGRTGSTFVMNALNTHPSFQLAMEPFHPTPSEREQINGETWQNGAGSWEFLQRSLFAPAATEGMVHGCKLFYFHARNGEAESTVWKHLETNSDVRLLLLHRANIFAGFVSETRARESKVWHPSNRNVKEYQAQRELTLNVDQALQYIQITRQHQETGTALAQGKPHLKLNYEDLASNAAGALNSIVAFLDAPSMTATWPQFQAGSASFQSTRILNLPEVARALAGIDAEWMLEPYLPAGS